MEDKKPHRTIKQLLDEAGLQPTEGDWEKMQAMLDKQLPTGSGKANPFTSWHTWMVAVGVVVTGMVGYVFFKNNSTGKNEMAVHQTEQIQPLNNTNIAKDTAAVLPGEVGSDISANHQQDEQNKLLNDTGKFKESMDVNTMDDDRPTSRVNDNNASTNKTSQPLNEAGNIDNQDGTHKPSASGTMRKERSLEQVDTSKPAKDNSNSNLVKKGTGGELYRKEQKNDSIVTAGRQNNNSGQEVATSNKTDYSSVDKNAIDQRALVMDSSSARKETDSIQNDTKQNSSTAKNEALKDTSRKAGNKGGKGNTEPGKSGFAVALQLSPLQWNMNNSKKVDFNVAPGLHAQYTFNRIGVGVTIFPFVINSVGRDLFYSRVDTTVSSDTFPVSQTITLTDYYTRNVTSYKGAINVSYQLTNKLLLEAGVGIQHLTRIEAETKQSIERDTVVSSIIKSFIQLKGSDSLFKRTAQNTNFLFFNVWYTAGHCQFGVGYSQNRKSWFTNTNGKAASQLQFNIRYLLDFRKKK